MSESSYPASRRMWGLVEPIHAVTYFSPEPLAQLKSAGFRGFWMGYFASRASPLGPVSAEVVHALFHNFTLTHVQRALPDAWKLASPEEALTARLEGSAAALRRLLGDLSTSPAVRRSAELISRAVASAPSDARPMFAANRALNEPSEDPVAWLWHGATLLREHRGDGHVAALTNSNISGREAHVLHSLATEIPRHVYERDRQFDLEEWDTTLDGLRARGYVNPAGALTTTGWALKATIEATTDNLAGAACRGISDTEMRELWSALQPLAHAVVASGELPMQSPMGLDLEHAAHAPARPWVKALEK